MKEKSRLNIDNLDSLRIRKVRRLKIYFDYNNKHYALLGVDKVSLFERKIDAYGKAKLIFLCTSNIYCRISSLIKDISKKTPKNIVYSNIDKEYFVKKLIKADLVDGLYTKEYENVQFRKSEISKEIENLKHKLKQLTDEKYSLDDNFLITKNHGSKQYTIDLKQQVSERVKGANIGTYCEEYDAYYGDEHPKYGGVLTDLYNLKCNTIFYCTNGDWYGVISANEHGDKIVIPFNNNDENTGLVLTKDHHSLYIKLKEV